MRIVSALVTALLSPLLLVPPLVLAGVLLCRGRRRPGWILLGVSLLLLLGLSVAPGRDLLVRPLEDRWPPFSRDRASGVSAVVVLGAGTLNASPEEGGAASLTDEGARRLVAGMELARSLGVRLLVCGGTVWDRPGSEPEAVVAGRHLVRLGFPSDRISLESKSRDTWENARLARELLDREAPGRIALVSSAYHLPRAMLAFARAGIDAVAAPTDYRSSRAPWDLLSFQPSFQRLAESFQALREYAGLLVYRLRR